MRSFFRCSVTCVRNMSTFPAAGENWLAGVRRSLLSENNIILMGPPGSGKTTVGRLVAASLKKKFVDGKLFGMVLRMSYISLLL